MLKLPVNCEWARISGNYCPQSLLVLASLPLSFCLLLEADGSCFFHNDFINRKILKNFYFAISLSVIFFMAWRSQGGQGLLCELSRSHSDTPHAVGLLWTSEISTWQHNMHKRQTSIARVEFEPSIPASDWPQTQALDRVATGNDQLEITYLEVVFLLCSIVFSH
jgi:hypothetical protein